MIGRLVARGVLGFGGPSGDRTLDTLLKRQTLYH